MFIVLAVQFRRKFALLFLVDRLGARLGVVQSGNFNFFGGLGVLRPMFVRYGLRASSVVLACCLSHAQTPTITSISPNPVGVGQSVTIAGTNFGTSGSVTFSGVAASTSSWASAAIISTVPVGTTTGNVVVTSGGHSSSPYPFTLNNGPVSYVYDDLSRLVAVIDVNGNTAEYAYDSVGNVQNISRFTSAQVSIIDFSPESGPTGALVTINGAGFSTTPGQDTVKFNSVSATVSSATNSQLQVTVPSAATTGPISVTSPNGTATSSTNFTVTASNGSPTITSFSPSSGVANSSVSLVGTNFDPTLANDKLRLNSSQAIVSAATPTSMATTVPSATASGHFTLLAPAGNAVSSQDFYVPFGTHVPGDIGFTARITPGGSQPLTLGANQIAMVLFDGVEGQWISIGVTGSTFSSCSMFLIAPDNTTTATTYCYGVGGNAYLTPTLLPKSGTYTIGIDASGAPGSLTLSLSGDFLGPIAIDGPAVTATTSALWQDVRLTFESTGQRVVEYATNVTNPGANLFVVTPNQTTLPQGVYIDNSPSGQTFFIDTQALGLGTYQLWVPHNAVAGGSETLQISSVPPDYTTQLTLPSPGTTGAVVRVPATGNFAVGQNAILTLILTSPQRVSLNVANSTIGGSNGSCILTVIGPSPSTTQVQYGLCGTGSAAYIDTVSLAAGTYTVLIDPQGTATGNVSISINNDQDVTTPTITIGGTVTAKTTVAGQDVRLSFTPTSSQPRIAVTATAPTGYNPALTLNLWSGTATQASISINNSAVGEVYFLDTQPVNANQQYQLWLQHSGTNFGGETLKLTNVPADISHTVTVGGSLYTFSTVAGQNANIKFTISSSESITVHWTGGTYPSTLNCYMTVTGPIPSTTEVGFGLCNAPTGTVSLGTISSGTYNIFVDPQAQSAGGIGLTVTTP